MDKVINGTPMSGPSLCQTCQQGVAIKGFGLKEEIHCNYTGRSIHFAVRQCSKYVNAATPDLLEMKRIAWVIESRNRGTWGFKDGESQTEIVVRPPSREDENQPPTGIGSV